jgi:cytochrome c-type biogenesis protein CcmE
MSLRFQRLLLILLTFVIILSAVLLILYNARENVSYFYTPSEIDNLDIAIDEKIRIGGFIENDSFNKISSSSFKFKITDEKASILVTFNGILPDLFREGQGAVIEGAFVDNDIFNATNVFAKHDENYMPASIKEDLKDTGYWNKKYK